MKHLRLFENFKSEIDVMSDLISRINRKELQLYMDDNNWESDDEESAIEYLLSDEYSLRVDDSGLIEFEYLDKSIIRLIGDNYVKLYHFAPEKYRDNINKDGLISGVVKTNSYQNSYSGIYLTTQTTGPVVNGYKTKIRDTHNCEPIMVVVKAKLQDISPDPDDSGISSGRYQFIISKVLPGDIVSIESV